MHSHMATEEAAKRAKQPDAEIPSLPPRQDHPAAWYGPELAADPGRWTWTLSASEISEVESAADAVLATGEGPVVLDKAAFPLPTVGPRLEALRDEVLRGRGFELVKGLPLAEWPREKAAAAFLGIGAHVGAARSQNGAGHLLGHVRDLGLASDDPSVRIYQTAERQTFHADSCDVVALACLCQAKSGGESLLCSALTVYNEILETRPELAAGPGDYVLKMVDYALKMMDYVLKPMDFVFKMTDFGRAPEARCDRSQRGGTGGDAGDL